MIPDSVKEQTRDMFDPLVKLAQKKKISPNTLTVAGLLLSAVTGVVYWSGPFRLASLFLLLAGVCDVLDGQVARRENRVTGFGAFLDSTLDRYAESFIWLGILFRYSSLGMISAQLYAFFALIGSLLVSYTRARSGEIGHETRLGPMERPERVVIIFIGTLFGVNVFVWFMLGLAILTNLTVIARIIQLSRKSELKQAR
jgi:CDP-diacylglycerol--glycerol-3-phosphate 3-phosphatidyltransferase